MSLLPDGFAGTVKGSFYEPPSWVDTKKKPGHTSQAGVYGDWGAVLKGYLTTSFFFFSPNLVWFLVAAAMYVVFPYDLDRAKKFEPLGWCFERFVINMFVTFAYFGWWSVSLYVWRWGQRKFDPSHNPTLARFLHNLFYCVAGVLQWTVWECGFVYCYATGRLGYVSDADAVATGPAMLKTAAAILFVPLWRDFHFYFAHRFLHMRFLYKYVHSLHHRNTDIDPWAGLTMHPVEHLYYFSCVGPSLYLHATPFMMLWNGVHLLISPAASHSGWEDNFQSDQFHYLHHRAFECNYGTSGPPLDKLFGTFRERLGKSREYQGEADDVVEEKVPANEFLSGGVGAADALPTSLQSTVYNGLYLAAFAAFLLAADGRLAAPAELVAAAVAFGPIFFGLVVLGLFGDQKSFLWPFHKEKVIGPTGIHIVIATFMVVLPTYHFVTTVLSEPGQAVYFQLMGTGQASAPVGNVTDL